MTKTVRRCLVRHADGHEFIRYDYDLPDTEEGVARAAKRFQDTVSRLEKHGAVVRAEDAGHYDPSRNVVVMGPEERVFMQDGKSGATTEVR